ncbi:NAP-like protein [Glarea lozoyensis ATCC 20868]|uniref:NAP-like protein n=1 Tax=Glarea lozoyensis (strain ATCC 20868 / MF5171) TaxID=1116229 RepID=S3CEB8_GLAL2|nr:NAP-like protein [Glarea lozoyensis ATCC 20868]EPE24802.1 NAP-like protein [Glarea lozoyensis ATCC 20868]
MSAALEDTPVSYEDLADLERDFDDAETEIIRQQVALTAPLYERRNKIVSQIPNFWPLVLEQAPPDIDQYIQPSDSALLLSHLTSLSVDRFELDLSSKPITGDPRSLSIRFEFSENELFSDSVLEKKFWYRRSKDGSAGLVSEPVRIEWKKNKDLTDGLLDMVCDARAAELKTATGNTAAHNGSKLSPEQEKLKTKIDSTGMGGLSFFAWFGFIGRKVSAEESAEATAKDEESRRSREAKKSAAPNTDDVVVVEDDEDEEDEDLDMGLEIFPDGDELAIAFTEDLWPGAIKYFTQAQEQDALSDADFESGDEEINGLLEQSATDDSSSDDGNNRPAKKARR